MANKRCRLACGTKNLAHVIEEMIEADIGEAFYIRKRKDGFFFNNLKKELGK